MSRDILAELERRRLLTRVFGRTTRGTYRQRFPKGFRQSIRERVLKEVASNHPEAIESLWRQKKISKAETYKAEAIL